MYYIIYKITNLLNNKIYIGKHKTENLDDDYMGSGVLIKQAIHKYGIQNFKKEILFMCTSEEEMNNLEIVIVNKEFVERKDTYNLTLGGVGGWYKANVLHFNGNNQVIRGKNSEEIQAIRKKAVNTLKNTWNIRKQDPEYMEKFSQKLSEACKQTWKTHTHPWVGRKHTEETKEKMHLTHQQNSHQKGEKNSQFGTCWVYNEQLKISKPIKKDELNLYLEQGWKRGRKQKWD